MSKCSCEHDIQPKGAATCSMPPSQADDHDHAHEDHDHDPVHGDRLGFNI